MDPDDLKEMLFGFPSSQDCLQQDCSEDFLGSDLDAAPDEDDSYDWDLNSNSPMLHSTPSDYDHNLALLDDPDQVGADGTSSPVHKFSSSTSITNDKDRVIARIEGILEGIVDGLLDNKTELSIVLKTRAGASRRSNGVAGSLDTAPSPKRRKIAFPGANTQEAWRFTVVIQILELIHSCLLDDTTITKRDMFYRHPNLFVKQSVVDRYVDDLACTIDVPRALLNVTAAAKGLVSGSFVIRREDGTSVNGLSEDDGILIPKISDADSLVMDLVRWVLVIEKEATFRALLCSPAWKIVRQQAIMVTQAKGYPDIASRRFLKYVADHSPRVEMLALVDYDPDGIAILSTYKYGSYRLAHENVTTGGTTILSLPRLRWLGVRGHQISRAPVTKPDKGDNDLVDAQGLMKLTARDRNKARQMLEWNLCSEGGPEPEWRRELQMMLMLNIKAEMQILEEFPGGLPKWLVHQLEGAQERDASIGGAASLATDTGSDDELLL